MLQVSMGTKLGSHSHPQAIDATAWLREHGLRATHGRIAIVQLLDASSVPLTLADIHEKVRAEVAISPPSSGSFRFSKRRNWCSAWRGSTARPGTKSNHAMAITIIIT
jgi:hypothetical protein